MTKPTLEWKHSCNQLPQVYVVVVIVVVVEDNDMMSCMQTREPRKRFYLWKLSQGNERPK